jgi:hypothetical protein
MPTATARYGRPKGSGLDDRQQLETLAALLAANPKLKPTTAIRQLGVEDPSAIRRLRDKFRLEQGKLMANARRAPRTGVVRSVRLTSNENLPGLPLAQSRALVPLAPQASEVVPAAPVNAFLVGWCDLAFSMLSAAAECQAVATQHWLHLPPVEAVIRRQLTLNSVAVAVYTRSRGRRRIFH